MERSVSSYSRESKGLKVLTKLTKTSFHCLPVYSAELVIIRDIVIFWATWASPFCLCFWLILWKLLFFRNAVKAILLYKIILHFFNKIVSASNKDLFEHKKSWFFQILAFSVTRNQRFLIFWFHIKHTEQRTPKIVWDTKNYFFEFFGIFLSLSEENILNTQLLKK